MNLFLFTATKKLNKMIEIRKTTQKEKAKHNNMAYVIDLGHTKQWFTEKALVELLDKLHKVVNENGLLQRVGELVCSCEMPAKVKGKNECWRCKRPLKDFLQTER